MTLVKRDIFEAAKNFDFDATVRAAISGDFTAMNACYECCDRHADGDAIALIQEKRRRQFQPSYLCGTARSVGAICPLPYPARYPSWRYSCGFIATWACPNCDYFSHMAHWRSVSAAVYRFWS